MKKVFDYILFFCFLTIAAGTIMYVMAEYPARLWVHSNKEFAQNLAYMEPEDPTRADTRYSAIILSFNQNEKPDTFGPKRAKFFYDFEGRGQAVVTGWAKPEAGMLIIIRDGQPKILGYDGSNTCGFEVLASADADGDGLITAADPLWADLKVWMDKNSNGRIDENELFSLSELKITALELNRRSVNEYLIDGNFIRDAGAFRFDGPQGALDQTGRLDEIFLRQHSAKVKFLNRVEVSPEIAAVVPDVPGSGLMRNLREAAALNPELASLSARLEAAETDERRWEILDELMSVWAGTGGLEQSLKTRLGDRYILLYDGFSGPKGAELARRLNVLDSWMGRHIFLLPHELNPVQQIAGQVVAHNEETGEISFNYEPLWAAIDTIYYKVTHGVFKAFFPGSEAVRPGTEELFMNKAGGPEAGR